MKYFLFCFAPIWIFANIDLRTNIQDVAQEHEFAELGSISLVITDNDFPSASLEEPAYIRIHLNGGHKLGQTLVNIESESTQHYPIYLGVRLEDGDPSHTIHAHPDTVSIVRWIRGESEIWIRIQTSSSEWIDSFGTLIPPSIQNGRCAFTLGISAIHSQDLLGARYLAGRANRPSNARNQSQMPGEDEAVSCLLIADMAYMSPYPSTESIVELLASSLRMDPQSISTSPSLPIESGFLGNSTFSGDDALGRVWSVSQKVSAYSGPFAVSRLCASNSQDGLVPMETWLSYQYDTTSDPGIPYIESVYHHRVIISVPVNAPFGFKVGPQETVSIPSKTEWWGNNPLETDSQDFFPVEDVDLHSAGNETVRAFEESLFTTQHGQTLARSIEIETWEHSLHSETLQLTLYQDFLSEATLVSLTITVEADFGLSGTWLEQGSFGTYQSGPPPSWRFLQEINQTMGEFVVCPQKKER